MIKTQLCLASSLAILCGCSTTHLIFFEEDHVGLKASFEANNPAPAELSLGYRRGIVAVLPQQAKNPSNQSDPVTIKSQKTDTNTVITIMHDPDELMSLYTVFKANVGFMDPVKIHHFLATGNAAAALLSNSADLRNLADILKATDTKGGQ